jgi:hypothetical protein
MSEKTPAMAILLTNNNTKELLLFKYEVIGPTLVTLPQKISGGSTDGGYGTKASDAPYQVKWSYSPDNGKTLLTFDCSLSGPNGITITPSKTGPEAGSWNISESPVIEDGIWVVRFYYS